MGYGPVFLYSFHLRLTGKTVGATCGRPRAVKDRPYKIWSICYFQGI